MTTHTYPSWVYETEECGPPTLGDATLMDEGGARVGTWIGVPKMRFGTSDEAQEHLKCILQHADSLGLEFVDTYSAYSSFAVYGDREIALSFSRNVLLNSVTSGD